MKTYVLLNKFDKIYIVDNLSKFLQYLNLHLIQKIFEQFFPPFFLNLSVISKCARTVQYLDSQHILSTKILARYTGLRAQKKRRGGEEKASFPSSNHVQPSPPPPQRSSTCVER